MRKYWTSAVPALKPVAVCDVERCTLWGSSVNKPRLKGFCGN